MKIRYFSDLHIEFLSPSDLDILISKISNGIDEICILAGDIGNPYLDNYDKFMKFISNNFSKTFIIAGNHEYYHDFFRLQQTKEYLANYFTKFHNISFLDNTFEIYQGYCFIGTTLWSHIYNPNYEINDVYKIANFDVNEYNKLNKDCCLFLEEMIEHNNNCIIITHHVPSSSLIDEKYKKPGMQPYNQWFYCNMDELIENKNEKIKCWFYGHTHSVSSKKIKDILFLCNPIGYPGENEILDFNSKIIL